MSEGEVWFWLTNSAPYKMCVISVDVIFEMIYKYLVKVDEHWIKAQLKLFWMQWILVDH